MLTNPVTYRLEFDFNPYGESFIEINNYLKIQSNIMNSTPSSYDFIIPSNLNTSNNLIYLILSFDENIFDGNNDVLVFNFELSSKQQKIGWKLI